MAIVKKLTRIGNSYGVILPKEILTEAGIDEKAEVEVDVREGEVVVRTVNMQDYKVMKTFLSVMKDYNPLLKKLAYKRMTREAFAAWFKEITGKKGNAVI